MRLTSLLKRRDFLGGITGLFALAACFPRKSWSISELEKNKSGERMIERYPPFDDKRSRKVIFVAHCVINQNARCNGSAETPSAIPGIPELLLKKRIGIIQMPCPELGCLGLGREGLIYDQLSTPGNRRFLRTIARDVAYQIRQYRKQGFRVLGIMGIDCSPSCGVECHAYNGEEPGKGAFMEELTEVLDKEGLQLPVFGVRDAEPEKALAWIEELDPS